MDMTESTVRIMLTAIEAPLYDVGVLSERGMLPELPPAKLWSSSAASDKTQKPKPLRTTKSTSSSISQPRKAGRTTKATTNPH